MDEKKRAYQREWKKNNRDKVNFYKRRRRRRPEVKEQIREYYRRWYKEHGRGRAKNYIELSIKWQKNNPEKCSSKNKLQYAIKVGKISRPDKCDVCKIECKPHGHHIDYDKALAVVWLCGSCHKRVHTGDLKLGT